MAVSGDAKCSVGGRFVSPEWVWHEKFLLGGSNSCESGDQTSAMKSTTSSLMRSASWSRVAT